MSDVAFDPPAEASGPPAAAPSSAAPACPAIARRYAEAVAEPAFVALATVFQALFDVPVACLTVFEGDQMVMMAGAGLPSTCRFDRTGTFCDTVVRTAKPLVVPDALADPRFATSPHVIGPANRFRFYVGIPLVTSDGRVLGTLCGFDVRERPVPDPTRLETVMTLARASLKRLELELSQAVYRERESALRRRTEILEATLDSIGQGVTAFDADLTLQVVNATTLDVLGFPPELATVGRDFLSCAEFMAAQGLYGEGEPTELARRRAAQVGTMEGFDFERTLRNGNTVRLQGVRLAKGGFLTTYTDMTQERAQDVALAYQSRYFRWQGAIGMIANAAADLESAILAYVRFSCEDLAYDLGHVWRMTPGGLVSTGLVHAEDGELPLGGDRAALRDLLHRPSRMASRAVFETEVTVIEADDVDCGDLAPLVPSTATSGFAVPVRISGELYVLEFFGCYPIVPKPSHKSLIAHLAAEMSRVAERQRVERLKDEFVATVGQELTSPLSSVQAALSEIPRAGLTEEVQTMLAVADADGRRLAHLVDNLVAIHRLDRAFEVPTFRPEDAHDLLVRSVSDQGTADRVRVQSEFGLCTLTEARSVIQILHNLLSNALKFSPDGSPVDLRACGRDGRIRIAVLDRGPGIPEDFRSSIFTRFAQADSSDTRRIGGMGLGLAVAKRLADRLGGRLGYEVGAAGGTTFLLDLPAARILSEAA